MKYQGKPTKGIEFYNLLIESDEFTSELGKVVLESGKLEAQLILFFSKKGVKDKYQNAPLGTLIIIAEKYKLLDNNNIEALQMVKEQRNYITHNIFALFADQKKETILDKENILDSDVEAYIERAWQLKENINALANNLKKLQS